MKKKVLLTPGPTPVPPEVLSALGRPIIHHRTSEFQDIFKEVNAGLQYVFATKDEVLTFASSGTGAMEGCVANLLSPGDLAICVSGGKFGERWGEICKAYGVKTIIINIEWGKAVQPAQIEEALKQNPEVKAAFVTHCETSTGVVTDVQALAKVVGATKAVLVVDAISSLGAMELAKDEWGVDVVVSGSQKALMIPPGLGFCSLSAKAWQLVEKSTNPKYYFNFTKARKLWQKADTPYTPAVSLVIGLNEALKMVQEEGLENVLKRHARLAQATRAAMKALGLKLLAEQPANAVTSVYVPQGIDGQKLVKLLRTTYGISIAGGQADLKGKIFRLAHLGYMNEFDMLLGIAAVEKGLVELGANIELGKGVKAAQEVFCGEKIGRK